MPHHQYSINIEYEIKQFEYNKLYYISSFFLNTYVLPKDICYFFTIGKALNKFNYFFIRPPSRIRVLFRYYPV